MSRSTWRFRALVNSCAVGQSSEFEGSVDSEEGVDRYHRPIDSSQRFWLNDQQVSGSNQCVFADVQLGYAVSYGRKTVVCK